MKASLMKKLTEKAIKDQPDRDFQGFLEQLKYEARNGNFEYNFEHVSEPTIAKLKKLGYTIIMPKPMTHDAGKTITYTYGQIIWGSKENNNGKS